MGGVDEVYKKGYQDGIKDAIDLIVGLHEHIEIDKNGKPVEPWDEKNFKLLQEGQPFVFSLQAEKELKELLGEDYTAFSRD